MTIFVSNPAYDANAVYDYNSLSAAVQSYWARSDLGGVFPYLCQAAEDQIYNDIFANNNGRGIPDIETTLAETINATTGQIAIPADCLGLKNAQVVVSGQALTLQRKNPEFIFNNYPDQSPTDVPAFIAQQGQVFIFGPFPNSAYNVQGIYWARSNPLSISNPQTWMTTSIASCLLACCNMVAAQFVKDPDAYELWKQSYMERLTSFLARKKAEEWSGSSLAMSPQ